MVVEVISTQGDLSTQFTTYRSISRQCAELSIVCHVEGTCASPWHFRSFQRDTWRSIPEDCRVFSAWRQSFSGKLARWSHVAHQRRVSRISIVVTAARTSFYCSFERYLSAEAAKYTRKYESSFHRSPRRAENRNPFRGVKAMKKNQLICQKKSSRTRLISSVSSDFNYVIAHVISFSFDIAKKKYQENV